MSRRHALAFTVLLLLAGACARPAPVREPSELPPLDAPALAADSVHAREVSLGVTHRYYWMREGPWAVHVLDIDRAHCWRLEAAKAGAGAAGRATTTSIAAEHARHAGNSVAGAVNGDYFLFAPPGVPTGPHIHDGRVITGPGMRPALIVDSAGDIAFDTLRTAGWLAASTFGTEIQGWNRPLPAGLSVFDASWGTVTDSATGATEVILSALPRGLVLAIDTVPDGVAIPVEGAVLVLGSAAPGVTRLQLSTLRAGTDSVSVAVAIAPRPPREALGGFPILVRDGAAVQGLDSAGGVRFGPVRHPRTAVGISADGRRVLLVVVDGRQPPYSEGMTLPELARLMLALGATGAINLDGGGSSTMVVAGGSGGGADLHVVNRPSDREGERSVGNALVLERGCRDASPSAPRTGLPRTASR